MNKSYPLPSPGTATDPTKVTNAVAQSLPLSDQADFEKTRKGICWAR